MPSQAHHHPVRARLILFRRKCLHVAHWHGRALIWIAAVIVLVWGLAAAWLQWWLFPRLDGYRPRMVAELSQRIGRPIEIGSAKGGWRLGQPYISLGELALKHQDGRPALTLKRADATLAWWPLVLGDIRFDSLTAVAPDLELTRDENGTLRLADLPLNEGKQDSSLGDWILRQHSIAIDDGRISWRDASLNAPPLVLEHVSFTMSNRLFGWHDLTLTARPPAPLASGFTVQADWRGDNLKRFEDWHGSVSTALSNVDLAAWGQWLRYPIEVRRGHGKLTLDLDFRGAHATAMDGALDVSDASLRLAHDLQPLDVTTLSGKLRWRDRGDTATLDLTNLRLTAAGGKLLDGSQASLKLTSRGGEVNAGGLTLPTLANLPPTLPLPNDVRKLLTGLKPVGRIDRFDANWTGGWREPSQYAGRVSFIGLGLSAPAPWPTLGPLDGELSVSDHDGRLNVGAHHFRFTAKDVYDDLTLDDLHARVDWNHAADDITVRLSDFSAHNADLDAGGMAVWHRKGQGLGELRLDATVSRMLASKVGAYLPQGIGPDTRKWLTASLLQGEARNARFQLSGPLDKFPFPQGQGGGWSMVAQARGVTLGYAPDWPRLEGIDGEVRIAGDRLEINAGGHMLGTRVERAHGVIEHLATSPGIQIDGSVSGATAEYFRFVANSPLDRTLNGLGSLARAEGEGRLELKLDIPFADANNTRVQGRYRIEHNKLQLGSVMPELRDLAGEVSFDEHGVTARGLTATTLGGTLRADIATDHEGAVAVNAVGRADSKQVCARYGIPLADAVSGVGDYRVQVDLPKSGMQVALTSGMSDIRVDLPAPLGKLVGDLRPLKLGIESRDDGERWRVVWGEVASADVARVPDKSGWHIDHGDIVIGNATPDVSRKGLWLDVQLPSLNLDPWAAWLKRSAAVAIGAGGSLPLAGATMRSKSVQLMGDRIDDLSLEARPQADGVWTLNVSSQQLAGTANWLSRGGGKLVARLDRLSLPLPDAAGPGDVGMPQHSSSKLPALDVVTSQFNYRAHDLGRMEIRAHPDRDDWLIDTLNVENPDGKLTLQGKWHNSVDDNATAVTLNVDSTNIGKLLDRFGYAGVMQRGRGSILADASWRGGPLDFDYPTLNGNLKIKVESGQFAKVNPGVGRLLGVLSLQSLPRRLTLDFHDVFSEGFAFDKIDGDSKVTRGVLATDNLTIVGPAAHVSFKGQANLADETQRLRVRIVPTVGDSIAVGAGVALANPVVGVGAFLLQRALKDPLGRLASYEYDITGRWDDPQVVKVVSDKPTRHVQVQSQ